MVEFMLQIIDYDESTSLYGICHDLFLICFYSRDLLGEKMDFWHEKSILSMKIRLLSMKNRFWKRKMGPGAHVRISSRMLIRGWTRSMIIDP